MKSPTRALCFFFTYFTTPIMGNQKLLGGINYV